MAFTPISNTVPQYSKNAGGASASGYYLKFYADGTTTPISMATDSTGGTLLAKCELDSLGYPTTDGANIFIPHIDQTYKLALYENATDADNNTLASAAWVVDDIETSATGAVSNSNGTSRTPQEWLDRQAQTYDTISTLAAETVLSVGDYVIVKNYSASRLDGPMFGEIVPSGTGTEDNRTYFDLSGSTTQFKRSFVEQELSMSSFGMAGDGVTNDTANFLLALAATPETGLLLAEPGKTYYFGALAGDAALATVTEKKTIDWQGSKIVIDGDNTSAWTGSAFIKAENTGFNMRNYIFEDTTFSLSAGPSRGVIPVLISNTTASSEGYTIGPCHIIKGQSFYTATATDAANFKASGITLTGSCTGEELYYGVNLASNGDNATGSYSLEQCNRLAFIYQVKGARLKGYCETGAATSGAVNISNLSNLDTVPTEDCELDMSFGELNGPLLFNFNNTGGVIGDDGKGVIRDVRVKFRAKTLGSNISGTTAPVIFRDYDTGGSAVSGATGVMDGLTLNVEVPTDLANPIVNSCDSPNFGTLDLNPANFTADSYQLGSFTLDKGYNTIFNAQSGSFATPITIPLLYLFPKMSSQLVRIRLTIATSEDTQFATQKSAITVLDLLGDISSGGVTTIRDQTTVSQSVFGGISPTFTIVDVTSTGISLTVNGYTNGSLNRVGVKTENLA